MSDEKQAEVGTRETVTPEATGGPKTVICLFAYGGIHPRTHLSLLRDCCRAATLTSIAQTCLDAGKEAPVRPWQVAIHQPPQDALIDRSRSIAAKRFLQGTDAEVLIMIDHDIEWQGGSADYEGDICHIARRCAETKGIVGGCVSKKARGQGVAVMWREDAEYQLGSDQLVEVNYVGSAFTAYHREALEAVTKTMPEIPPGFAPIFLPMVVDHPMAPGNKLHLSEDWAFCERARALGYKTYASLRPLTTHWGEHGFTVIGDACPPDSPKVEAPPQPQGDEPHTTISLLHATRGRPEKAAEARKLWLERASGHHTLEYIVSVDEDDSTANGCSWAAGAKIIKGASRGNVDAYNRAAWASSGTVLVQVHDDVVPPQDWDRLIVQRLGDLTKPAVLHVGDGTQMNPDKPWLIPILIGTRPYFTECGYFFHPDYVSIYCDDDQSLRAKEKGCVIEAKDIVFTHAWGGAQGDATYRRSYRKENWDHGAAVLAERKAAGFPTKAELWPAAQQ